VQTGPFGSQLHAEDYVLPPRPVDGIARRVIDGHEGECRGGRSAMAISKLPMCWRA
jgi:hypothetical protein